MKYNYMFEEWRPIEGYEGIYEVSNFGRVKNVKKGTIRKLGVTRGGYNDVILFKNGKFKNFKVHRLVAKAFIPNPLNLPCVNHKDENKLNNYVCVNQDGSVDPEKSNLEWCDWRYNLHYGTALKRRGKKQGVQREKKVKVFFKDGTFYKEYESQNKCAADIGIHISTLSAFLHQKYCGEDVKGFVFSR